MTSPITQTWPLAKETSKNNLCFSSFYPGCESVSYMPLQMQLVLIFDGDDAAEDLLHKDAKLLIFLGSSLDIVYYEQSRVILDKNRNKNMFTIPFSVNIGNEVPKFTVSSKQISSGNLYDQVRAMITFPGGKPRNIVGSYLMVTGCRDVVVVQSPSTQCE